MRVATRGWMDGGVRVRERTLGRGLVWSGAGHCGRCCDIIVVVWEATGRVWAKICRRSMFAQRHRLWLELHVHRRSGPSATPPAHLTRIELVQPPASLNNKTCHRCNDNECCTSNGRSNDSILPRNCNCNVKMLHLKATSSQTISPTPSGTSSSHPLRP